MSTPKDPRGEGQPAYDPYGQQGGYRAGQQPGQYASSPLPGPYQPPYPAQGQPRSAGYDPYGGSAPVGWGKADEEPVKRPGLMVLALVLMIMVALPFLVGGVAGLATVTANDIPAEVLSNADVLRAGGTPALILQAVQLVLGFLVVVAVIYLMLAVVAFRGRNWARIVLTVLTVAFVLLLLAGLASGSTTGGLIAFVVAIAVAMIGGVVILFLPDSNRFFSRPR